MLCDCTKRSVSQLTRLLFHGRRNLHPENVPRKLFLRFLTTSPASAQEVQKTLVDQPAIPGYDHVPPAKLLPISAAFPTAKKIAGNSRKLKRVPFLAVSNEEKILTIREGNKSTEIPLLWLRDSCTCEKCVNQGAYQRNSWTVITNAQIEKAEVNNGFIHATWTDGHESHHDLSIIKQMLRKPDSSQSVQHLWDSEELKNDKRLLPVPHDTVFTDSGLRDLLSSIQRYGFGLVNNCDVSETATEALIKRVGPPMATTFSPGMWTFTSNMERGDTAYSSVYLAPHTDTTYFSNPGRIQVFHCLEREGCHGGDNILVDAFKCAEKLRMVNPRAHKLLATVPQECVYIEPGVCYKWTETVLGQDTDEKSLKRVRFNMYDRSTTPPHGSAREVNSFYESLKDYADLTQSAENQYLLQLTPGLVIFIDNWRVLHGRTAFSGKRVMTGCYMSNDEFEHACRKLAVIH